MTYIAQRCQKVQVSCGVSISEVCVQQWLWSLHILSAVNSRHLLWLQAGCSHTVSAAVHSVNSHPSGTRAPVNTHERWIALLMRPESVPESEDIKKEGFNAVGDSQGWFVCLFLCVHPMHDEFQFEAFFNLTQCDAQNILCYDLNFPFLYYHDCV